jgi:large subunit ribosomal protein L24
MAEAKKAVKLKVRKGDRVVVLSGRDKGKTGEILKAMPKDERVIVSGVNLVKRHTKPRPGNPGGIDEREASIHVSNVAHADPSTGRPTRVGFRTLDDGRKVRFAKRSGELIDR